MLAALMATIGGPRITLNSTYTVSDSTVSPTNTQH